MALDNKTARIINDFRDKMTNDFASAVGRNVELMSEVTCKEAAISSYIMASLDMFTTACLEAYKLGLMNDAELVEYLTQASVTILHICQRDKREASKGA